MTDEITRIIAAVEPLICPTWSERGETIEGRISKDDFWILVDLARKGIMAVERNEVFDELEKLTKELDEKSVSQALPFEIEKWLMTIKAHCTVIADPGPDDDVKELAYCIKINVDQELRPAIAALSTVPVAVQDDQKNIEGIIK